MSCCIENDLFNIYNVCASKLLAHNEKIKRTEIQEKNTQFIYKYCDFKIIH